MRSKGFCKTCSIAAGFQVVSLIEHVSETKGVCLGCQTEVVRRECGGDLAHQWWFPLAEAFVGLICPHCKTLFKVNDEVQAIPEIPQWVKEAFAAVTAGVVIGGLAVAAIEGLAYLDRQLSS